jgi:hypothetical protein
MEPDPPESHEDETFGLFELIFEWFDIGWFPLDDDDDDEEDSNWL